MSKTYLKWPGNKQRLASQIKTVLPAGQRLIEPFVGSGAIFMNTDYPTYLLADNNADLINLHVTVTIHAEKFSQDTQTLFNGDFNNAESYYAIRKAFNQRTETPYLAAMHFLYLNRHCFNGLCRYNSDGEFNVPFGKYKNPYFPTAELAGFAQKASLVNFIAQDFTVTMSQAEKGDVIYCDPPYMPLSATANFTNYTSSTFGLQRQNQLADLAKQCVALGVPVVISNHDTPITRELYKAARKIITFPVRRSISCKGEARGYAPELLALYLP